MAWTETDLQAVKAAIANPASEVRDSDGRTYKGRPLEELLRIKREIESELGIITTTNTPRATRGQCDRGF